ncbi:hypothetical protein ED312_10320 [Sinomicrobium pectinilyticum]|uniref:Uncharacterized protein n=1 Tax=Sinomicrobium pectinilyticum TaxID=1084421 RepID=A0A3N0EH43_SINP1|nr:hypothetical protein [Sinomicrobium pectinilyticum]RNL87198.1 hypothetical protein ED312_10320 [Sinomicrobium pectinilyticum]
MNSKIFKPILVLAFSILSTSVFGQKSRKNDEALRFAIEERYKKDQAYAQAKRAAFNRSSWIGSKLSELISSWGPPTRVVTDGADGKIAVYEKASYNSGGTYTPGYVVTNGWGQVVAEKKSEDTRWSSSYSETVAVYADKDNIIREVKFDNTYKQN